MELGIPYQKIEISKIHIVPQQTGYLPFEYKDGDLTLHRIVMVTPMLKVLNFWEDRGKIEFECDFGFLGKVSALQEVIKAVLFMQQGLFCKDRLTREEIERGFKCLSYNGKFICYVPSFIRSSGMRVVGVDGSLSYLPPREIFVAGRVLRLGVKLGGIKVRGGRDGGGMAFFIDHQIMHIWDPMRCKIE